MTKNNTEKRITSKDLYDIQLISTCALSPDGQTVVYPVHWVEEKTEKKYANLWSVDTNTAKARQITFGKQMDTNPQWSPDGKSIAFTSNREEETQLYIIQFGGGEAEKMTDVKGSIGYFEWSPDGKKIVFNLQRKSKESIEQETDEQKKKLGVVARHYTKASYKFDGMGYKTDTHWGISVLTVKGKKVEDLTKGKKHDENHPTWSPDGKKIAYTSNISDDAHLATEAEDLFVMEIKTKKKQKISTQAGQLQLPSWSPDGEWIAYLAKDGLEWYRNNNLWRVKADGSSEPENLTKQYDLNLDTYTTNDTMGVPAHSAPVWSKDSQSITFQIAKHGRASIHNLQLSDKSLSTVLDEKGVAGPISYDAEQNILAVVLGTMTDPCQIAVKKGKKVKVLTNLNHKLLQKRNLGEIEEVWFKGADENDLQGWIVKPPNFNPKKKYPSILQIHGGPLLQYGEAFTHEFYYLAAKGYVVYFCNPRGGQGYGENHAKAIWNDWGGADYKDLMAWTDYMTKLPYIDIKRMGVTGGSYGGYMTNWIIGHTDRFKAGVTQRCVSNLVSMWGSSDGNWIFQQCFGDKPPFEDMENFWRMSPIKYIGNAKTPTLVIHSEKDYRCNLEQGEQVYIALKKLGVDTELVIFPDESHGLSRIGRTDRRVVRLEHIGRWFDKYLAK
ncbi:MAG: S9 family peptidase [Chitinophagales bacterium]